MIYVVNTIEEYKQLVEEWRLQDKNKVSIPTIQELMNWLLKQKRYQDYENIKEKIELEGFYVIHFQNGEVIIF